VYANALAERGLERVIPEEATRARINAAIFDELCQGIFAPVTIEMFVRAIADLRSTGAECVILGCTEIPLIITPENSPLPGVDSTRLLAAYAVREAISDRPRERRGGWLSLALPVG
jgi:aspartate racemase